ncbi:MAG: tRNA lysidine(34) synthetase TilS, partial [Duncaniella sp.]|nr:tRNA lysidine(34) synthetase TilS [Duncaniella sp.]
GDCIWTVRAWRQGDRMQPFGMNGSRLVSDIFNDLKIGASKKNCIPLLFRNADLIWIAGIRASNLYRVSKHTEKVIKLVYRDGDKG